MQFLETSQYNYSLPLLENFKGHNLEREFTVKKLGN